MIRAVLAATTAFALPGSPSMAIDVSEEEVCHIMALLNDMKCEMDDVFCSDGQ